MNSGGTAFCRPVLRGSCSAPTKRRIPTPVCGLARNDRERDVVEAVSYSAIQREALSLRTSDRVTGVEIRYPPPPSAREVSARSGDGGRDSAHPRAGHMGPALQSTAGMLTGRRPLRNDRRARPYKRTAVTTCAFWLYSRRDCAIIYHQIMGAQVLFSLCA